MGSGAVPEPPAGRVRAAGHDARSRGAGGHLRRGHRRAARRRGPRRAPAAPPLMLAVLHSLSDPWVDPVGRRALLEVALLGVTGGVLGCWIVFYELSYSAESLAHALLPGLVLAALA